MPSRFLLLVSPGGWLTCCAPNDPALKDRYAGWSVVFNIHRPLTADNAGAAKAWTVRHGA